MAKKNYNLLIGVMALVGIILSVSIIGYVVSRPKDIVIQGEAEATEYRVSGKVPGRLEAFCAEEGDQVRKGEFVPESDGEDEDALAPAGSPVAAPACPPRLLD